LKLRLVSSTPCAEALIAAAVLTTTSGAQPSVLFDRMASRPERVREIIQRIEVQHGSVLEHNRFTWVAEADDSEALGVLLRNRFFSFTRIGGERWLVSGNLRSVYEYAERRRDDFGDQMLESIREAAPTVHGLIWGKRR
jgi:hypothetical protein